MKMKKAGDSVDNVNHPDHYANQGTVECIDFIGTIVTQYPGFIAGDLQNVIKYTWRSHGKNGKEDIKKAAWYLNHAEKRFLALSSLQKSFLLKLQQSLKDMTSTPDQIRNEKNTLTAGLEEVTKNMPKQEKELYALVIDGVRDFYSDSSRKWAKDALAEWSQKYAVFVNKAKELKAVKQAVVISKRKVSTRECQR